VEHARDNQRKPVTPWQHGRGFIKQEISSPTRRSASMLPTQPQLFRTGNPCLANCKFSRHFVDFAS
jgi:hypothetical protein